MKPATTIQPPRWMGAPEMRRVVDALTEVDRPARFVGGCVRDTVLDRPIKDIDIATPLAPEDVTARLTAADVRVVPTGLKHGTVTAILAQPVAAGDGDIDHVEITTLRVDIDTDGRRATVSFTDDWSADAARRDFTLNALFCDPDGTIYDPVGGLADLQAGRVRFVGDPEQRIREDVLRLLRFFRFQAHYGTPPAHQQALAACAALAPLLPTLSGERVAGEVLRLLGAEEPATILSLMAGHGVLAHVLPEARMIDRLAALVTVEGLHGDTDPLRRLAAVLAARAEDAEAVAVRLRLSNVQSERLLAIAVPKVSVALGQEEPVYRRALYRVGAEIFADLVLLAWAETVALGVPQDEDAWGALLALADKWQRPQLPVRGRDALALGFVRGPAVGKALAAVESWWVDGDFTADRETCLARLRAELTTLS